MAHKFMNFFDRELDGLHQAALFLALAAIISKLLALLRDRFLAPLLLSRTIFTIFCFCWFRLTP